MEKPSETPLREKNPPGLHITFALVLGILLSSLFYFLLHNGSYGWTLFCVIPFSAGMGVGTYLRSGATSKVLKVIVYSTLIIAVVCGLLMFLGLEGLICILMALGILIVPLILGMSAGLLIRKAFRLHTILLIVLLNTSSVYYDANSGESVSSIASESVLIHAPREKIWAVLTGRVEFTPNQNWFFRKGVSSPSSMEVNREENGDCYLSCSYTYGDVKLRILDMDSLERIRFEVDTGLVTMREVSVYDHIDAPHLKGYFMPEYGEFTISPARGGGWLLTATTSYSYRITPAFYWRWWTDYLTNTMHRNVLEDIRRLSGPE